MQRSIWREHVCGLIPILSIYFSLAFYQLDHQSLWLDEVISVEHINSGESFLTRGPWFGGRGPLYTVLLGLWATWGSSEFALRSLSVLLGGITVSLGYMTGLRLCHRRVAWIHTVLLATSPFLLWYSQEVRYVSLMIAAALFGMYTFHRVLCAKGPERWLLYGGSLLLAIAAFVVNILLPMAQGLYLVCSPLRRPLLRKWLVCQLLVFALFLWWANDGRVGHLGGYWQRLLTQVTPSGATLPASPSIERLASGGSREFSIMALPYTFFAFSAGFSLGPSLEELHVSRSLAALWPHAFTLAIANLLCGSLFLLGLMALWRRPETGSFLTAWFAVPIIGAVGVSAIFPDMAYNVRYVGMSLPAYTLILAAGIASFRRAVVQMTFLAAVLLLHGLSLANYYHNPRYGREDARSAARYLEAAAEAEDLIAVVGNGTALRYYYRGSLPIVSGSEWVISHPSAWAGPRQAVDTEHARIWLVAIRPWEEDPTGTVTAALGDRYTLLQHQKLPGVNIYLYRRRQVSSPAFPGISGTAAAEMNKGVFRQPERRRNDLWHTPLRSSSPAPEALSVTIWCRILRGGDTGYVEWI